MGFYKISRVALLCCVFLFLCHRCGGSEYSFKFLKAPHAFSHLNSATFVFQVSKGGKGICSSCNISCKLLDLSIASDCGSGKIFYSSLPDGNHTFVVCTSGSQGAECTTYNWTVDTVAPTAYVSSSMAFTNSLTVPVNIAFTELCTGGGGFRCSSVNACNLLVYGSGQVIPSSLVVQQPSLKYSLLVRLSSTIQYGRLTLVMEKAFCTDAAGNAFTRSENSRYYIHFDRRSVSVELRVHAPEKPLQLNGKTRTVQATNKPAHLKIFLYFSAPILNSSAELLRSLNTSQGELHPIIGENHGERRFGFAISGISSMATISVNFNSNDVISRYGTHVSPTAPATFLFDAQRPKMRLSTYYVRTRVSNIAVSIKFSKPVFGFNSSLMSISGGYVKRFHEISRRIYLAEIEAADGVLSISIPENVTADVAGNKNTASNILHVTHYCRPLISSMVSTFATASFLLTSIAAGLITASIASLQSAGAYAGPSSSLTSDPARNLFRSACHIQVFAFSRWMAVTLPVEYYEFSRSLEWSVPYFSLPWETEGIQFQPLLWEQTPHSSLLSVISKPYIENIPDFVQFKEENSKGASSAYGLPLTAMEYASYFESQNLDPVAEYISDRSSVNGWREFDRSMFWLAVIGGSLFLLHLLLLSILKFKKNDSEKRSYGALAFPRLEMFLVILALPCICKASAALVRGGAVSGVVTGILLLGVSTFLLISLLLFLSVGITLGKLLQYKEVHQVGQRYHWYQELIRVTLGPGKRGQWTWRNQTSSVYLTILGPLFEDLRGPPKYMLSQISGSNSKKPADPLIASDDETEDAEAPFIQKLFGILRIYYTAVESVKRAALGILAGVFSENLVSRIPTVILLTITSFQLFFLVLKKPFIKKKVQLVEIISLSCEVGFFATCLVLSKKNPEHPARDEVGVGVLLIVLFLLGFLVQMVNEWYALYRQINELHFAEKSFLTGLKIASVGLIMYFIPHKMAKRFESKFPVGRREGETMDTVTCAERNHNSSSSGSSGTRDKPWLKQLRELAKAGFVNKDGRGDPSTSRPRESANSSVNSSFSSDIKWKPNKLYRDLEAIFASK